MLKCWAELDSPGQGERQSGKVNEAGLVSSNADEETRSTAVVGRPASGEGW